MLNSHIMVSLREETLLDVAFHSLQLNCGSGFILELINSSSIKNSEKNFNFYCNGKKCAVKMTFRRMTCWYVLLIYHLYILYQGND